METYTDILILRVQDAQEQCVGGRATHDSRDGGGRIASGTAIEEAKAEVGWGYIAYWIPAFAGMTECAFHSGLEPGEVVHGSAVNEIKDEVQLINFSLAATFDNSKELNDAAH